MQHPLFLEKAMGLLEETGIFHSNSEPLGHRRQKGQFPLAVAFGLRGGEMKTSNHTIPVNQRDGDMGMKSHMAQALVGFEVRPQRSILADEGLSLPYDPPELMRPERRERQCAAAPRAHYG